MRHTHTRIYIYIYICKHMHFRLIGCTWIYSRYWHNIKNMCNLFVLAYIYIYIIIYIYIYIHAIFRSQWAASRARILLITATKRVMPGANANQGFFQDSIVQPQKNWVSNNWVSNCCLLSIDVLSLTFLSFHRFMSGWCEHESSRT